MHRWQVIGGITTAKGVYLQVRKCKDCGIELTGPSFGYWRKPTPPCYEQLVIDFSKPIDAPPEAPRPKKPRQSRKGWKRGFFKPLDALAREHKAQQRAWWREWWKERLAADKAKRQAYYRNVIKPKREADRKARQLA